VLTLPSRFRTGLLIAACCAASAGCGSGAAKVVASSTTALATTTIPAAAATTSTPTAVTVTTTTTRAATTTPATTAVATTAVVTATDATTSVTLRRGQTVRVILGSTYWTFDPPSNAAVLRLQGPPAVAPSKPCVPGGGCGTVTASYTAVAAGQSMVLATRSSCGEAMGCTVAGSHYTLIVTVD
jgi:hypothetical protein